MMRPIDGHVHVGHWNLEDFAGQGTTLRQAQWVYARWNWAGALVCSTDRAENLVLLETLESAPASPVCWRMAWWACPKRDKDLGALREQVSRVAALKIHPSLSRLPVTDPSFAPYLALAEDQGLPVVVHCGRWREMAGFELALQAARLHPGTSFVLGHMGGDSPALVKGAVEAVVEDRMDNVFFGTESIREPWLLEHAVRELGSDRLVFGSDYNLNHPEPFRRLIEVLDLTDAQREDIFRNNINRLMREGKKFF